ncbi:hypothetical protein ACW5F0_08185 [Luteimonas sp. A534]
MAQRPILEAILIGGLIGGALDLLFAVSFAGYNGVAPSRIFQTIASGLLGDAAFSGGGGVAAIGVGCHFALSVLWAVVFAIAAWKLPVLARRPFVAGLAFGLIVFLGMRLLVLPLSAYPHPVTFKPLATVLDLLSHMLLFGVPIAMIVSRAIRARRPNNSFKPNPLRGSA